MNRKKLVEEGQRNSAPSSVKTVAFIKPATESQRLLVKSIKNNDITIGYGPAGTGKSLISLFTGVQLLNSDSSIERILYVRANVDSREEKEMGALPGSLADKVKPLAYPVLDNLVQFMGMGEANYLLESGKVEVSPLSMMRGRSLANTFIIVDECQNISAKGMKTILTRLAGGSKMILLGDPEQSDVFSPVSNGLYDAVARLQSIQEVGIVRFSRNDIVRHGLTGRILDVYEGIY